MKIAFVNRPKGRWIGGDYIQMEKTKEAIELANPSIRVDILDHPPGPNEYHIIHAWNFSMPWSRFLEYPITGSKFVSSMIYHENNDIPQNIQQNMLNNLSAAIFLHWGEVERARKYIKIPTPKINILPNGIDNKWNVEKEKGEYALTVGRIEPSKGQLECALACRDLGIKYVIVGQIVDVGYYCDCLLAGAEYLGQKNQDELINIYKKAKALLAMSYAELMPMTVMEAGSMGVPCVLTENCMWHIDTHRAIYGKVSSIKEAITEALESPKDLRGQLKVYKWENVAKKLIKIYASL